MLIYNANSKNKYQKRLVLRDTNEKSFDVSRCIICQHQSDTTVTSTENGRRKIIEAAAVAKRPGVRSSRLTKVTLCAKLWNPFKNQIYQIIKQFNVVMKVEKL